MKRYDEAGGFILTGGESTRMGRDKALLPLLGVTLLERTVRKVQPLVQYAAVVGRSPEHAGLDWSVYHDDLPGLGPLGGIVTALRLAGELQPAASWCLVVACDMPYLTAEWLDFLLGRATASQADAILPMSEGGPEPLCAAYHRRCAQPVSAAVARGVRKVTDAFEGLRVEYIHPREWKPFASGGELFKNMNTPEDYAEAQARFSSA